MSYFDVLGHRFYTQRKPSEPAGPVSISLLLTIIGLMVTAFHELTYRQTGGGEFPVLHVLSHAGGDMLMLLGILIASVAIAQLVNVRGVR